MSAIKKLLPIFLVSTISLSSGCTEAPYDPPTVYNLASSTCYSNGWIEIETVTQQQGVGGGGEVVKLVNENTNNSLNVNYENGFASNDPAVEYPRNILFIKAEGNLTVEESYELKTKGFGNVSESAEVCAPKREIFDPYEYRKEIREKMRNMTE
jgi:hypothetical protein